MNFATFALLPKVRGVKTDISFVALGPIKIYNEGTNKLKSSITKSFNIINIKFGWTRGTHAIENLEFYLTMNNYNNLVLLI